MNRQTNGQMNKQINKQIDKQTDKHKNKHTDGQDIPQWHTAERSPHQMREDE